jgi:N,N'-diacetyllegionaminate synthase
MWSNGLKGNRCSRFSDRPSLYVLCEMTTKVKIGDRWIGEGEPCFIIAEAGSNHNGSLEQARSLIDVAAEAGADAVKFQLFRASKLYLPTAGQSDYLKLDKSIYDIIHEMEMPYEWLPQLAAYCQRTGIIFLASAFDEESVDELDPYVPAYKIASYEMTHLPLLRHIAIKGKPTIISTGTAHLEEVDETVDAYLETGNSDLMLMQCTASYPAPTESLNLKAITTMKESFQVPVGLSDHSRDPLVGPMAAVGLGASLVEKHFTLSNRLPGPDHAFAVEPDELRLMIQKIRDVEQALGDGIKARHSVETELYDFARRYIFSIQPIPKGHLLSKQNLAVLRKGKLAGVLPPKDWERVLGKRATKDIESGGPLTEIDFE